MSVSAAKVAVDNDPVVVVSAPTVPARRRRVYLRTESGDDPVYLGGSGVTAATGMPLLATDLVVPFELGENDTLYGVCASAETATVHVLTT